MEKLPLILALDATTGPCSVALTRGSELLAERAEPRGAAQSRVLVPMMQDVLQQARVRYQDIQLIIGTTGPGSFTGIRIGLATARAAGLAAKVEVRGVSSFEALAQEAQPHATGPIACALTAGKGEIYLQCFDAALAPLGEPCVTAMHDVTLPQGALLCGNAAEALAPHLPAGTYAMRSDIAHPQARYAAFFAAHKDSQLGAAAPLYIRPPDAIIPARPITAQS